MQATIKKTLLSILLSIVLVVSLCPTIAYAAPAQDDAASDVAAEQVDETSLDAEGADAAAAEEAVADLPAATDEGDEAVEPEAEVAETVEAEAEELIGFVYIDAAAVETGEVENVAIGLADEDAVVADAVLTLQRSEDGELFTTDAQAVADNAMLFTFESEETGLYYLQTVEYQLEGADDTYVVDFEAIAVDGDYSFDVVSSEVMGIIDADTSEGEVTAVVLDEEGGIEVADSVEEAIEIADEEGIASVDEPESPANAVADILGVRNAYADVVTNTRDAHLIVAIDPGHGGSDSGATDTYNGTTVREKNMNLSIAKAMRAELQKYTGVTVYMTRTTDEYVGLEDRVDQAAARGADVFISIHINAGGGKGAEVYYPNGSSYNKSTHSTGYALASKIQKNLVALGLTDRGTKMRTSDTKKYPDGSKRDYYSVIRNSRMHNIPGIIVEHAFIDTTSDYNNYLSSEAKLTKLGVADANGVVAQYSLGKDSTAKAKSLVAVEARVKKLGWESVVYDGKVAGTTGKGMNMNAFTVELTNDAAAAGGVRYAVNDGKWIYNGATAGSSSDSATIQFIQIQLRDGAEEKYDVYYRVHVSKIGWMGWAKNNQWAGTDGYGLNVQAMQVRMVPKGGAAPGSTSDHFRKAMVQSSAHVQSYGWLDWTGDGMAIGTTGKSKRLEAIKLKLYDQPVSGGITYRTHVQTYGWQGWVSDGALSGTTGKSKRLEAIQIELTGEMAEQYDVYYRAHAQTYGWMGWAKNGAKAGTAGMSKRLEAIQVVIVKKGDPAPGSTSNPYRTS